MGGRLGRFLQGIKRTGADVAIDDAERSQRRRQWQRVVMDRTSDWRSGHCSPNQHFFAAQSASGRRELLAAMSVDLQVHHHYVRLSFRYTQEGIWLSVHTGGNMAQCTHRREYGSVYTQEGIWLSRANLKCRTIAVSRPQ